MTPREIAAELARLKALAKTLIVAIETLQTRLDGPAAPTAPPPGKPTTRIRRVTPQRVASVGELPASKITEPPPPSSPTSARGAYRFVPSNPPRKR
jgi:hypothetical protein